MQCRITRIKPHPPPLHRRAELERVQIPSGTPIYSEGQLGEREQTIFVARGRQPRIKLGQRFFRVYIEQFVQV